MVNKVILVGNLGADAEVRTLESGVKVARCRLATSERVKRNEEWVDHTEWHSVVLWRNLADVVDKYTKKGSRIYVEGVLRYGEYEDKDGHTQRKVEIVANEVKLLDRKEESTTAQKLPSLKEQRGQVASTKQAQIVNNNSQEDDLPF